MKYIKRYLTLVLIIGFLISCSESFIDIEPKGTKSSVSFEVEKGVTGCYAAFYSTVTPGQYWNNTFLEFLGDIISDDSYTGGISVSDQAEFVQMETFNILPTMNWVRSFWNNNYQYINIFNETLKQIDPLTDLPDNLKNRYLAEVRFLRAYAYKRLLLAYGSESGNLGLVLVDENTDAGNLDEKTRSNWFETWEFITNDLKFAEEYLPKKSEYPVSDLGRATSGAAQALLARAYMYQKDWVNCQTFAQKVIDSDEYQLETNFGDIYETYNEHGVESIFEIVYAVIDEPGNSSHANINVTAQNPRGPWGSGWGLNVLTGDLLNEMEQDSGDPRIIWTFIFEGDIDISTGKNDTLKNSNEWGYNPDRLYKRKVWVPQSQAITPRNFSEKNRMVIRYADILLMAAEAYNENGNTAQALTYLNMIRKRARESSFNDPYRIVDKYPFPKTGLTPEERVPDVTTTDKTILRNAIWHERRVELNSEGYNRFFDLVRQERAASVMGAFYEKYQINNKGRFFENGKSESMPIPETTITYSNGVIQQNPGY